ncbi:methyltransferase domain-containing protein [Micromonospora sp. WMMD998]|uniref:methyltransferase domain-containing protein n=1 Tax=Micromonospora sp. WMMD998 TaxID=3016092 RepID=UPI00249AC5D9|nr:methyltransferase domain-containing protein [Micromonospora sp. WMMD998]WFE41117.1 methyltransferase domain-containing protein [Micromonospora sp. WMMD998]
MSTARAVQRFYDTISDPYADAWDHNFHLGYCDDPQRPGAIGDSTERLTDEVLRRLPTRAGDKVLDVGCGIGKPALRLAGSREVSVTGISISDEQIGIATGAAQAQGVTNRVGFALADMTSIPYPDGSFDAAMALECLHHVAERDRALRQIRRVLRPGGSFVLADYALRHEPAEADRPVVDEFRSACYLATLTTIDDYVRSVTGAGFTVTESVDVSENVRPTLHQHAAAMRASREELIRFLPAAKLDAMIEASERYGVLSVAGYVIIVARAEGNAGNG